MHKQANPLLARVLNQGRDAAQRLGSGWQHTRPILNNSNPLQPGLLQRGQNLLSNPHARLAGGTGLLGAAAMAPQIGRQLDTSVSPPPTTTHPANVPATTTPADAPAASSGMGGLQSFGTGALSAWLLSKLLGGQSSGSHALLGGLLGAGGNYLYNNQGARDSLWNMLPSQVHDIFGGMKKKSNEIVPEEDNAGQEDIPGQAGKRDYHALLERMEKRRNPDGLVPKWNWLS